MKKILYPITLLLFTTLTGSMCKNSPTEPEKNCPEKPKTSSRNFTWRTDTLGKAGSSVGDVWVVNENDIYVGGEFYIKDFDQYNHNNLAHWDGQNWEMRRVYFVYTYGIPGFIDSSASKINSIRYFSDNDIVVSSSGGITRWNGAEWLTKDPPLDFLKGTLQKVYGTSSTNLFYGGTNSSQSVGSLTHFNGENFENIETGITLPVQDFFGRGDTVFLVASKWWLLTGELYQVNLNTKTFSRYTELGLSKAFLSIWFYGDTLYCGNNDKLSKKSFSDTTWKQVSLPWTVKGIFSMYGNSNYDIMAVGGFGLIAHYNGENWKEYQAPEVADRSYGNYTRISGKENVFAMIGESSSHSFVTLAFRK